MINYEVALGQFELFVLILIRLASFVYAAPFFNTANVPRKFKVGFAIALVILAGIRERLEYSEIPKSFQGIAIVFITAGLLAMAFMGFSGMKI